ncbi:MAG TPA: PQQ-dependent sugar dehydrogenase, partial [Thermoanaerobaculia bacterium]|nr:PQQ-dependent sugar dehydrogenase [Thermoanaerobaculia bacterium]
MRRALLLLLALLAAGPVRGENLFTIDPPPPSIPVALRPVLAGLERPTSIAHAGDDRLFLTLQEGLVVFLDGEALHPQPFLDIRSLMTAPKPQAHGGEQGLLGLAFHPRYAENGLFFVCYTDRNGAVTVARYRVSDNPGRADPASGRILLSLPKKQPNHNGGQIQFGPDGYLYIAVGDGGAEGDPECLAQKDSSLFGKILRIDVDVDLDAGATLPPYYGIP